MPELPEVETIARDLHRLLRDREIAGVRIRRSDVLRDTSVAALRRRLPRSRIERVSRRGKSIIVDLHTRQHLVIHLRFTGSVLVDPPASGATDPYRVMTFPLADGGSFAYRDVRRLGTIRLLDSAALARWEAKLGVEPLDERFTTTRLSDFLRSSAQAVKKAIMDQRRMAGVGNIYANEALWLARVDPSRRSCDLTDDDVERLHDAVVKVLRDALEKRGTTFRDFRDALGERGNYAPSLMVYGRGGERCVRCATRLAETHAIDGRSTVFCFRCQS